MIKLFPRRLSLRLKLLLSHLLVVVPFIVFFAVAAWRITDVIDATGRASAEHLRELSLELRIEDHVHQIDGNAFLYATTAL